MGGFLRDYSRDEEEEVRREDDAAGPDGVLFARRASAHDGERRVGAGKVGVCCKTRYKPRRAKSEINIVACAISRLRLLTGKVHDSKVEDELGDLSGRNGALPRAADLERGERVVEVCAR